MRNSGRSRAEGSPAQAADVLQDGRGEARLPEEGLREDRKGTFLLVGLTGRGTNIRRAVRSCIEAEARFNLTKRSHDNKIQTMAKYY